MKGRGTPISLPRLLEVQPQLVLTGKPASGEEGSEQGSLSEQEAGAAVGDAEGYCLDSPQPGARAAKWTGRWHPGPRSQVSLVPLEP